MQHDWGFTIYLHRAGVCRIEELCANVAMHSKTAFCDICTLKNLRTGLPYTNTIGAKENIVIDL